MQSLKRLALVAPLVFGAVAVLGADQAQAQRRVSLDEGPVVRRKLLFRSSRFEVMPQVGFTMNDAYKRNVLGGVDLNYYLTNEFGIGVTLAYGGLQLDTDLLEQVDSTLDDAVKNELSYAVITAMADAHLSYVPIFGKFSIFRNDINYDIHLLGGFGVALIDADGPNAGAAQFTGVAPAPVVGGGGRLFINDSIAATLTLKNYIYSAADSQSGDVTPESELRSNYLLSLGVSIFFPGEVAVSR